MIFGGFRLLRTIHRTPEQMIRGKSGKGKYKKLINYILSGYEVV